jgi:hypothetical protein
VNGKKNDVVVVIGQSKYGDKADWVRIMALTESDIFQVTMRDAILDLGSINPAAVITKVQETVMTTYKRKSMKDFAFLENQIDPPTWVIATSLSGVILAYILAFIFIPRMVVGNTGYRRRF